MSTEGFLSQLSPRDIESISIDRLTICRDSEGEVIAWTGGFENDNK